MQEDNANQQQPSQSSDQASHQSAQSTQQPREPIHVDTSSSSRLNKGQDNDFETKAKK